MDYRINVIPDISELIKGENVMYNHEELFNILQMLLARVTKLEQDNETLATIVKKEINNV